MLGDDDPAWDRASSRRPARARGPGAPPGRRPQDADREGATLLAGLERLVDAGRRGDPERPLRWTAKSVRKLAEELREQGHEVALSTVRQLLRGLGYSLQANGKTQEGAQHPDRDAQFEHINAPSRRRSRPASR